MRGEIVRNKKDVVIELSDVYKEYRTTTNKHFRALDGINLQVFSGDRIGIVGPNGSGKSTLLKIIAGITRTSGGLMRVRAKVASLIDLEAGFEPELSGYENISINGLILGMTKSYLNTHMKSIIEFSGIGEYIHEPFYTYSDGMKFRLACSVAIHCNVDVIVFDEILVSGDWDFQKKVFRFLSRILKQKKITVIICSHVPELLWSIAEKFYLIEKGKIKRIDRSYIRQLAITHHKQFHRLFKTDGIDEFGLRKKNF